MASLHWQKYRVFIAGVCALLLTAGLARFAYTPLLPIMKTQAHLSDLAGGWLATFNYMGYMTGVLLAASISRLQIKYHLYRLGLIIAVLSTAAMGFTDNVMLWALLRYIAGAATVCGILIASGLIMNWLLRNHYKPLLGIHFTGLGLGIVVSGIAVGLMATHLPWHQQWLSLGLLGVLFFIPAWFWMPIPADVPAHATQAQRKAPSKKWMNTLIAAYFCAGFGFVISATFIVTILEKLPILSGHGSWVWVIVGLAATPSTFLWDRIASQIGQIPALLWAYGLQVISIALPVMTDALSWNLLSAVLYGNTFVGIVSLTLSLIGAHFPNNPAKAMARLTLSYGVAQIIAPAMAGYIAQVTGSYHGALVITTIIMLLGMVLLVLLQQLERAEQAVLITEKS